MDHPSTYRVVYVEPGKPACEKEIGSDLKSLQEAVGGGLIECVYPHRDNTLIVCNDELFTSNSVKITLAVIDAAVMERISGRMDRV